jgi:hypothetical protein
VLYSSTILVKGLFKDFNSVSSSIEHLKFLLLDMWVICTTLQKILAVLLTVGCFMIK